MRQTSPDPLVVAVVIAAGVVPPAWLFLLAWGIV